MNAYNSIQPKLKFYAFLGKSASKKEKPSKLYKQIMRGRLGTESVLDLRSKDTLSDFKKSPQISIGRERRNLS